LFSFACCLLPVARCEIELMFGCKKGNRARFFDSYKIKNEIEVLFGCKKPLLVQERQQGTRGRFLFLFKIKTTNQNAIITMTMVEVMFVARKAQGDVCFCLFF
jgi:hypothetical protein